MHDTLANTFKHRQNRDGSHDSICCTCFLTVASTRQESVLCHFEHRHACDPVQLYEVTEYSRRVFSDIQRNNSAANPLMSIARSA